MTLLTALLTRDYVLTVADRRVTVPNGKIVDDGRNKVIQCGQTLAFTYTGLAVLEASPTDAWLARQLTTLLTFDDPFTALAELAESAFSGVAGPISIKRHAFLAVGWVRSDESTLLSPAAITVSNALGTDWKWLPQVGQFKADGVGIPDGYWWHLIRPLGAPFSEKQFRELGDIVRRCRRHKVTPLGMAHALARFIRSVATYQPSVGRDLVAVIVPRPPAIASPTYFSTPLPGNSVNAAALSCFLMLEKERRFKWTLPAFVENGVAFLDTLFELNDDGWTFSSQIIGRPASGTAGLAIQVGEELHTLSITSDGQLFQSVVPRQPSPAA